MYYLFCQKNFRSTGKVDPILSENGQSSSGHKPNEVSISCSHCLVRFIPGMSPIKVLISFIVQSVKGEANSISLLNCFRDSQ